MWKTPDGTYLANRNRVRLKRNRVRLKRNRVRLKKFTLFIEKRNIVVSAPTFGRALASSGSYFCIGGRQLLLYMYSGSYVPATSLGYAERANYFQYQNIPARRTVSSETNHQFPQVSPVWIATQPHSNHLTSRQLTVSIKHRNKSLSPEYSYPASAFLFWVRSVEKGVFRNGVNKRVSESCAVVRSSEKGMTIFGLVLWTSYVHKTCFVSMV